MSDSTLLRLAGLAAIAGGFLRVANEFAGSLDRAMLQWDYIATDVFLLLGLIGIYAKYRNVAGIAGLAGFTGAVVGLTLVRSSTSFPSYRIAAAITLCATAILGASLVSQRGMPRAIGALWLCALAAGIAGVAVPAFAPADAIAGILYGAGFALGGVELLRRA